MHLSSSARRTEFLRYLASCLDLPTKNQKQLATRLWIKLVLGCLISLHHGKAHSETVELRTFWKAGREISGDAERRHVLPLTGSSTYLYFGCYSTSALQPFFLACEGIPRPMKSFGVWRSSVMAQNADFMCFVSFGRNRRIQPLRSYPSSSSRDETFHGVKKCKRTDDWLKQ